ncbi:MULTISPECIES: hypothetical protein [unclassified Streptomyces]|uniref:hypothetical protein n=1 Tax=unclassified Streptomyces TaxID=2593676 RepID=UPI001CD306F5|nr:hypothetical protein [Streptomyces sp. CoH27]
MSRITRIIRKDDDSRAERPRRRLGLATAVASAVVVAGGVMVPAVAASAAPMHQPAAVTMAPRHDHHHDGDDWDHWEHHHHWHYWHYFWNWDHDCWEWGW